MPVKFDTRRKDHLLAPERYASLKPEELLRELGLKQGNTMADIGCGPGFFTIPAAKIVGPKGRVIAADIQGEMLTAVRSAIMEQHFTNVVLVKTSDTHISVAPESCDFVLLAFVLHEIGQRATFLHQAARLLKPEAHLVVLETTTEHQENVQPQNTPITPEELDFDAAAAGLRKLTQRDLSDGQYLSVFSRATRPLKAPPSAVESPAGA
jgi:ubiquinone/menaquinone biosynthesis C-methylase UbiE